MTQQTALDELILRVRRWAKYSVAPLSTHVQDYALNFPRGFQAAAQDPRYLAWCKEQDLIEDKHVLFIQRELALKNNALLRRLVAKEQDRKAMSPLKKVERYYDPCIEDDSEY